MLMGQLTGDGSLAVTLTGAVTQGEAEVKPGALEASEASEGRGGCANRPDPRGWYEEPSSARACNSARPSASDKLICA